MWFTKSMLCYLCRLAPACIKAWKGPPGADIACPNSVLAEAYLSSLSLKAAYMHVIYKLKLFLRPLIGKKPINEILGIQWFNYWY